MNGVLSLNATGPGVILFHKNSKNWSFCEKIVISKGVSGKVIKMGILQASTGNVNTLA